MDSHELTVGIAKKSVDPARDSTVSNNLTGTVNALGDCVEKSRAVELGKESICKAHKTVRPGTETNVKTGNIAILIDPERHSSLVVPCSRVGGVKRNEYGLLGRDGRNREYGCDHDPTEL